MPSDLVINVRQVSNYPPLAVSDGTENVLVQQSGIGGPYATLSTADLVATALHGGPALGVGVAPPANADGGQIFSGEFVMPADGAAAWNAYTDTTSIWRLLNAGSAATIGWDPAGGFNVAISTAGSAGDALTWVSQLLLSNAGNLQLPFGTLTVARDPAYAMEVATLNYVSNNTVASFNARRGQVQLNQADIYSALCLDSPIASQNYVNQAIQAGLENLLTTCPFVNRWNNRTGSVYLMLADIECVFYQSGQIPMSPTPPANSNDDSIATTKWVSQIYAPAPTLPTPPLNPVSGQLWWDSTDGNLYVYYVDPTSAQWVSAMADGGGTGAFLPLSGGTISPGPLTVSNPAIFAPGITINPVGQYDMPPVPPTANWRSNVVSTLSTAADGGHFTDATMNAGMFVSNIYGAPNFNVFNLVGQVNFNGTGGTGQHCALVGYGTRISSVAQPTTTVAVTLGSPSNNLQVADVTNLQLPYPTTIKIGNNGYIQTGVSGASGPGTITVIPQVTVADGTAGNAIIGKNNPQVWGANIYANDISGVDSLHSNALVGIELDIGANGLDDDGVFYHGAPFGNRTALSIVGLQTNTSGAATEIGTGISIGTGGGSSVTFKRCFTVFNQTHFSQAAFDTRDAVQLSGANTIWLSDGQTVAYNTAGTITAGYTGGNLQFIDTTGNSGGQPDFTFAAPNNAYGLNLKLLGNGTNPSKMIRIAGGVFYILDDAEVTNLFIMDNSGNITVEGGLFRFINLPINAANDAAAAAAGIQVGGLYRNGSAVQIRVT